MIKERYKIIFDSILRESKGEKSVEKKQKEDKRDREKERWYQKPNKLGFSQTLIFLVYSNKRTGT